MALKLKQTNNQGVEYNYLVAQAMPDVLHKETSVALLGFLNEEARDSGCTTVHDIYIGTMEGIYNTGEEIYAFVKTVEPFTEAVDC